MMLLVMMMFVSPSTAWAQGNDPGNGSAVTSYGDAADGTVYEISFKDLNVGSKDGVIYGEMNTVNGHIIIGESNPVNVAASETLYGDVNVDGSVDNLDVTLINKYLLGTAELSEQGKKNADVDANGTIDTTDSLNILKCCQELIEQSEFPIK